jgi:acetyl-CoA carboxylase carboxyl transferase subunit alpha
MRITARDLLALRLIDEIIPEPGGGAHTDPAAAAHAVGQAIDRHLAELAALPTETLLAARYQRYRAFGALLDSAPVALGV